MFMFFLPSFGDVLFDGSRTYPSFAKEDERIEDNDERESEWEIGDDSSGILFGIDPVISTIFKTDYKYRMVILITLTTSSWNLIKFQIRNLDLTIYYE